jgi:hypothetical protein
LAIVRRDHIPLALVALLALLTGGFAVLAVSMAPNGASLAVQNASEATFGLPLGSHSFSLDLISTVSSGRGGGVISQERYINYMPPDRMVVYRTSPSVKLLGVLHADAIAKVLAGYAAVTAGSTPWVDHGARYTRTEELVPFSARVSHIPSAVGKVYETAIVWEGYLIYINLHVVVPSQTFTGGKSDAGGVVGETFHMLRILGTKTPALPA